MSLSLARDIDGNTLSGPAVELCNSGDCSVVLPNVGLFNGSALGEAALGDEAWPDIPLASAGRIETNPSVNLRRLESGSVDMTWKCGELGPFAIDGGGNSFLGKPDAFTRRTASITAAFSVAVRNC